MPSSLFVAEFCRCTLAEAAPAVQQGSAAERSAECVRFRRKRLLRLHKLIIAYFQLVLHYILNILFQVV